MHVICFNISFYRSLISCFSLSNQEKDSQAARFINLALNCKWNMNAEWCGASIWTRFLRKWMSTSTTICNLLIIWRSCRLSCRTLFFPELSGHATAYSELHAVTLKGNHLAVPYACRSDACITNCSERWVSELSYHWDMSVTCNSIQRRLCIVQLSSFDK